MASRFSLIAIIPSGLYVLCCRVVIYGRCIHLPGFEEIQSLFYSSSCFSLFLAKAWMHSCVGPAKFMFSRVKLDSFTRGIEKYVNLTTDSLLHSTIGRYRRDFLLQCLSPCRLLAV